MLMLILKRNFILHVLNVVKCTLKSGTELKVKKVVESKKANFCDVFCLDVVFDVDSNKRH